MGTPQTTPTGDRGTRRAALWATVVAVPVTLLVAGLAVAGLSPDGTGRAAPDPTPSATAARPVPTGPVAMTAAPLAQRPATVCRALISRLPAQLRDLAQRPVTAGPEQNAAYGEPALTVACGAPAAAVVADADVWVVDGVCWQAGEAPEGTVLTTVDREVPVRVTVPAAYRPPLQWVAPVSGALVEAVPSAKTRPSGCAG
jgi:hypothetical protein